jgi:hypothetical protein
VKEARPRITTETIRGILSDPYPKGLCFHYYQEFLGTLWSLIFDLNAGTAEICFGSPIVNQWHTLMCPAQQNQLNILSHFLRKWPNPVFWQQVPVEA